MVGKKEFTSSIESLTKAGVFANFHVSEALEEPLKLIGDALANNNASIPTNQLCAEIRTTWLTQASFLLKASGAPVGPSAQQTEISINIAWRFLYEDIGNLRIKDKEILRNRLEAEFIKNPLQYPLEIRELWRTVLANQTGPDQDSPFAKGLDFLDKNLASASTPPPSPSDASTTSTGPDPTEIIRAFIKDRSFGLDVRGDWRGASLVANYEVGIGMHSGNPALSDKEYHIELDGDKLIVFDKTNKTESGKYTPITDPIRLQIILNIHRNKIINEIYPAEAAIKARELAAAEARRAFAAAAARNNTTAPPRTVASHGAKTAPGEATEISPAKKVELKTNYPDLCTSIHKLEDYASKLKQGTGVEQSAGDYAKKLADNLWRCLVGHVDQKRPLNDYTGPFMETLVQGHKNMGAYNRTGVLHQLLMVIRDAVQCIVGSKERTTNQRLFKTTRQKMVDEIQKEAQKVDFKTNGGQGRKP